MSLEFNYQKLGSISNIKGGKRLPKGHSLIKIPNSHPYIKVKDMALDKLLKLTDNFEYIENETFNEISHYIVNNGDLIISIVGTIGLTNIIEQSLDNANLTENCAKITNLKKGYNVEYIYYFLNSKIGQNLIQESTVGAVQKKLPIKNIRDLNIPFPNYDIQNKIVILLSTIDKKIENCKSINNNLDDLLDLLFKVNFIDKFNNDDTNWKNTKIGELPLIITDYVANGSFASLKENVSILDYEDYAYFIRNTDLKSKCFEKFVKKHSYDFLKKSSLFGNEIIISNVGDVGSVFLCPFLDKPMTLGNNMILVKSDNDTIYLNFYLFLLFRSNYGKYLISTITTGSVQSKFNKTEFKSLELIMPDDDLIIRFNKTVSPIFEYKNKISDEIINLTKLRDILLPKLISGEINVSKINCDLD